jgi:hypothetical protein
MCKVLSVNTITRTIRVQVWLGYASGSLGRYQITLPLSDARLITGGIIPALAAGGGIIASDTDPYLAPITANKEIGLIWPAGSVVPICFPGIPIPPFFAVLSSSGFYVNFRGYSADHNKITMGVYFDINDTNRGGDTNALTTAVSSQYVYGSGFATSLHPNSVTIYMTPKAHVTNPCVMLTASLTLQNPAASTEAKACIDFDNNYLDFTASFTSKF